MGFSRQEYWRGLPFPPAGGLPDPEADPTSPALAGEFFTIEPAGKPCYLWRLPSPELAFSFCQGVSDPGSGGSSPGRCYHADSSCGPTDVLSLEVQGWVRGLHCTTAPR